jgi:hypothetical protein
MIRDIKHTHFCEVASNNHGSKQFWREIKTLLPGKNTSASPNITTSTFNDYFASVGKKISEKFKDSPPVINTITSPQSIYQFAFRMVTPDETLRLLTKLSDKSSLDVLGIDSKLLCIGKHILSPILTHLFNLSIVTHTYPSDWKLARITPIFKHKGSKDDPENYRPISITCHISKIMENHVNSQLVNFLTLHNFITTDQFAFITNHSTSTCLHKFIDDCLQNIDDNLLTGVLLLDIQKCFDTINHDQLLNKLSWYGVKGNELGWFQSYLRDRQQCVMLNGETSTVNTLNIGIPQGSVLGPILFLIYINDISQHVRPGQCNIFADDVLIYTTGKSIIEINMKLQSAADSANSWYLRNKLNVNAKKCETILIHSKFIPIKDKINISLGGIPIPDSKKVKYLGVTITDTLDWTDHIESICVKIRPIISTIYRKRSHLPKTILRTLYTSYIQPHIDYAITIWGNSPKSHLRKLQRQQHFMARIILNNFDHINHRGSDLLKELQFQNIQQRYEYLTTTLTFKCIHGMAPTSISDQIIKLSDIRLYPCRAISQYDLLVPNCRTSLCKKSFQIAAPTLWNNLPNNIKAAPSLFILQKLYKATILCL